MPTELSGILATSGYMITGIVLSCLVSEVAKIARVPSLPLFAISDGFALICLLGGTLTGITVSPSLAQTSTGTALVGLGCLYLIALAASWLFGHSHTPSTKSRRVIESEKTRGKDFAQAHETEATQTPYTPQTTASRWPPSELANLAKRCNLSEQEHDILLLLVEGRTITRIARELYLSPSAVKYHAKKLYRLFKVHSRSELTNAIALLCHESPDELYATDNLVSTYDLSLREQEVLTCLIRGFTTSETASNLSISENTVKTHVKRLYGKLGVHSKQEVIDLILGHTLSA